MSKREIDGESPAKAAVSLPGSSGTTENPAGRRLLWELKEVQRCQHTRSDPVFTVELVNDNLYEWHVRLHKIDPESDLAKDLSKLKVPHILLHLAFPKNFPFAPPFMRVVEPTIEGGRVLDGGAICMELLSPQGWSSVYTVEAVIMQFIATVVQGGRVITSPAREFSRDLAEEQFRSAVKYHDEYGWGTPDHS
ncbi:ubiquitin-conjugating enzyme domain-containing protein [Phthorimaea operculella]|nr:ubiquitin-conjugating enzyme domain-containing protein [Phthorimaea operculella]